MKVVKMKQRKPIYMRDFDLGKIPEREISFVKLNLLNQATGPIELPLMVAKGHHDGPVFGITAAVHGNEVNGIPVIHELFKSLRLNRLHGTIVAALVVNVPGFINNQRSIHNGVDLNHVMPGIPNGNFHQIYAHRFTKQILEKLDYLIDLHTASFGRINSLYVRVNLDNREAAEIAALQNPQIILHNPAADYTVRGAAAELGIPAITIEIGDPSKFQYNFIKRTVVGIKSVMGHVGMTNYVPKSIVSTPIICERSYWVYTDNGGILRVLPGLCDRIEKKQLIAQLYNIFGEKSREYICPHPGVVIGKSINPVAETGARILHIGIESKTKANKWRKWLEAKF